LETLTRSKLFTIFTLLALSLNFQLVAQQSLSFDEGLVIRTSRSYGRTAIGKDLVQYQLVRQELQNPKEGSNLGSGLPEDTTQWETISIGDNGYFQDRKLRGGYLYLQKEVEEEKIMLLQASGHSMLYVNGEARGGDVYDYGWVSHPIKLNKGINTFLFKGSRGRVKVELVEPISQAQFTTKDLTLPSIFPEEEEALWAAIRVLNSAEKTQQKLSISVELDGKELTTKLPEITALSSRKVGFQIPQLKLSAAQQNVSLFLSLKDAKDNVLDTVSITLKVAEEGKPYERTFISNIDGSVQYFSVNPSSGDAEHPALFLSLHGASVEARNQARAYTPKDWGVIVSPTNRRPFGFDWEDWGRLDALEVLSLGKKMFNTDPQKTYLTGHSMGGHGTWQLGVNFPDQFAAIAPCAGWSSFFSYGGRSREASENEFEQLLGRGASSSHTLKLSGNYKDVGIYILHGDADETVPVSEARAMKQHLGEFHSDFSYYEYKGGSHWYGNESVDWAPIFNYFKWHTIPQDEEKLVVDFKTASPGVSASSYWVSILQQQSPFDYSHVRIEQDTAAAIFSGTTENVSTLALSTSHLKKAESIRITLDSLNTLELSAEADTIYLRKAGEKWEETQKPAKTEKGPHRNGGFKDAFRNRFVLVYGTSGSKEENAWAYNKARYDAETFWYRGNGSVDVVSDKSFKATDYPDRNVIIYGNADTNRAWKKLLKDSPLQVNNGHINFGEQTYSGEDLACYFVRPRADSDVASVGIVSGTGMQGFRAANENRYFVSGSGFPDVLIFGKEAYLNGVESVKVTGFFGNDWSIEKGDFAIRNNSL